MSRNEIVLVVASDPDEREQLAAWLEDEGHETMLCPGPLGREACLGLRGPRCPLSAAADLVVVDMGSEKDPIDGSVAGWELVNSYLAQGLSVAAVVLPGATLLIDESAGRFTAIDRPAGRKRLLDVVRALSAA